MEKLKVNRDMYSKSISFNAGKRLWKKLFMKIKANTNVKDVNTAEAIILFGGSLK